MSGPGARGAATASGSVVMTNGSAMIDKLRAFVSRVFVVLRRAFGSAILRGQQSKAQGGTMRKAFC